MPGRWTTNIVLKIVALLCAVVIWKLYNTEQLAIRFVSVPLHFQNLPANRELSGEVPGVVTVQLEAPEAVARGLVPEQMDATVDLSGVGLGTQRLRVAPADVRVPTGARVLAITPDEISLVVESKTRKALPVEARTRGEVPAGFRLVEISVVPTRVSIEGPESAVRQTEKAVTDWIDLRGRTASFQQGVAVDPVNASVRLVGAGSAIATVTIEPIPVETEGEPGSAEGGEEGTGDGDDGDGP